VTDETKRKRIYARLIIPFGEMSEAKKQLVFEAEKCLKKAGVVFDVGSNVVSTGKKLVHLNREWELDHSLDGAFLYLSKEQPKKKTTTTTNRTCAECGDDVPDTEQFRAKDDVWRSVARPGENLHIDCFEKRLRRGLQRWDLDFGHPASKMLFIGVLMAEVHHEYEQGPDPGRCCHCGLRENHRLHPGGGGFATGVRQPPDAHKMVTLVKGDQ